MQLYQEKTDRDDKSFAQTQSQNGPTTAGMVAKVNVYKAICKDNICRFFGLQTLPFVGSQQAATENTASHSNPFPHWDLHRHIGAYIGEEDRYGCRNLQSKDESTLTRTKWNVLCGRDKPLQED